MELRIKRVYEKAANSDGRRVLLDRLWPRGIRKEDAHIHYWARDLAVSAELRKWFGHDPARWPEFRKRYRAEIRANKDGIAALREKVGDAKRVTIVFGARDEEHNNAVVLCEYLHEHPLD
ncbi:MAG TPA: DUF488 family protein [Gammaproteobacteria bacterium]|nr:DUF488 family protein [Gammaproteobacteria bacterium]